MQLSVPAVLAHTAWQIRHVVLYHGSDSPRSNVLTNKYTHKKNNYAAERGDKEKVITVMLKATAVSTIANATKTIASAMATTMTI